MSQFTFFVGLAGVACVAALIGIIVQWIKANDASAVADAGIKARLAAPHPAREHLSLAVAHADAGAHPGVAGTRARDEVRAPTAADARPVALADDETALSRLLFGWGGASTVVGLVAGGLLYGALGALLGAVIASTAGVAAVVIGVLVASRFNAASR